MTSTQSLPLCSSAPDNTLEAHELPENTTPIHGTSKMLKKCEHTIRSQKQFTHLPANSQAAMYTRLSKEDKPRCDECAILEDIVANRCEKCLFAQELASQRSKSCEPKSQPVSRRSSPSKGRAPSLPSTLPLSRTETEAELLVCPPIARTRPQSALIDNKTAVAEEDQAVSSLPHVEIIKRDKTKAQFPASNIYVIQPTFQQTISPQPYQATKAVQCKKRRKSSSAKKRSASYNRKNTFNPDSEQKDSQENFLELDSDSNNKFLDSELSLKQEDKSRSKSRTSNRTRCVLIQCNLPKKPPSSKLKPRSKSVSPTEMRYHSYDLPRSSFSELCLGSSSSELSEKLNELASQSPNKGSAGLDTEIVIEEKIYVKCPTDSIRKKKITTGNKSILSRKSLASDIRSLLCKEELLGSKESSDQLNCKKSDSSIVSSSKLSANEKSLNKRSSSPDKKKSVCSRNSNSPSKSLSPDRKSAFSRVSSISSGKNSCISQDKSEYSDSRSSKDDGCDCSDDKPDNISGYSRDSDEKCVCFDETSMASQKLEVTKNRDSCKSYTLAQSESDFSSALCERSNKKRASFRKDEASKRNCCSFGERNNNRKSCLCQSGTPDQSETNCCKTFYEDKGNKRRSHFDERNVLNSESNICPFREKIGQKRCLSYESEAPEQSEIDFCAPFRKNRGNNVDRCYAGTDSDDFHSCCDVDSNALRSLTRDFEKAKKPCKNVSEEIDIEACKEMVQSGAWCQSKAQLDSHTSVHFKTHKSRITCIFVTLIILIVLFSVAMLAWRITKGGE